MLQAQVFDEWLDARGTGLTGVVVDNETTVSSALINHYRTLGHDIITTEQLMAV